VGGRRLSVLVTAATLVAAVAAPGAAAATKAPDEWDRRVDRFVDFVERERGLGFEHPVKVRFLDDEAFDRALREGEEEPTAEDEALDEQYAGELVALGLAASRLSQDAAEDDADASTVGYYDSETEELVVRGTDLDVVDVRVTIVHELVHALQDQHFDMDALYDATDDDGEVTALDFLTEGDATAVETAYIDSLPPEVQDEYYASGSGGELEEGVDPVEGVPYVLDLFGAAPYLLGEAYIGALEQIGGKDARDRTYRDLPTTEEVLLDPVALERDEDAERVPTPDLGDGEIKARDAQPLGALTLYLMLATRLEPRAALEAVTGWGGDRSIGFERDGAACVRFGVTGDTRQDTRELASALTAWAATLPPGAATVQRDGAIVTVTACEAAGVTEPTVEVFDRAFYNVLGGRISTILDVASYGVPLRAARCIGDTVSTDAQVMAIYDRVLVDGSDPTEAEQQQVDDAFIAAGSSCGVEE
jgi:hypothetical protein